MTILLGAGGHGADISAIYERVNGVEITVVDHDATRGAVPTVQDYDLPCYIGINDSRKRADVARQYVLYGGAPLIDPSAEIGSDCSLAPGVVIGPHSLLLTDVAIGRHGHVHYMCSMTRCSIGEFSTICPGAVLCGDITIGAETTIGAGAVIANLVAIGDRCIIGAGAIVPPNSNVPDDTVVVGVYKS